ncbi:hypothetical protein CBS147332_4318 [Penicillium roqueforti]|nr:hypothetical protein CBS147332_4318 [Penicillium roqueforti]
MSNPGYPSAWKPGKPPRSVVRHRWGQPLFNTLTATAYDLQQMMIAGTLRSTDLVEDGPSLEMKTSAGAVALLNTKSTKNAQVADKLLAAGAVILGKTTISVEEKVSHAVCLQLTAKDSPYIPGGFDPTDSIGGHTVPGGSSSGVSIVISAGLAANGVGTDTDAFITAPAVRASLYLIRPTTGIVSVNGTVPCPKTFDTIGPMGRSVRDVADLLTALVEPGKTKTPQGGYASSATKNHGKSFRIGTLDPEVWNYPDFLVNPVPEATERINRIILETYSKIREGLASVFHENADLPPVSEFMLNGKHSIYTSWISNELMFSTTTSASCQDLP